MRSDTGIILMPAEARKLHAGQLALAEAFDVRGDACPFNVGDSVEISEPCDGCRSGMPILHCRCCIEPRGTFAVVRHVGERIEKQRMWPVVVALADGRDAK